MPEQTRVKSVRFTIRGYHIAACLLVGCDAPAGGGSTEGGGDVVSIRVEPPEVTLETVTGSPVEQTFQAIATFSDGDEGVLDLVSWELSNASVGLIDSRGLFTSVDSNGGEATVTATFLDKVGSAELHLTHHTEYIEEGVSADGAAALGEASSGEAGLTITYPFEGTTLPRNLEGLKVLWEGGNSTDLVRLQFASSLESVDVYTTGVGWTVPVDVWEAVSATNRRGSLTIKAFSASWDGANLGPVLESEPVSVTVNRFDTSGSVLYWSTADTAIMRIVAGAAEVQRFYPKEATTQCFGCHEISEGRQWMVVTKDGVNGTYQVLDVADPENPTILYDTIDAKRMTFHALSPDGQKILGVLNGALVVYDLGTNTFVATVTPDEHRYTHPNWSPDGTRIVATRAVGAMMSDMAVSGTEVVTATWDGSKLNNLEVLIADEPGVSFYYPAFSPDGEWVVFNRSTGDCYADDDAELWLVAVSGGAPVRLDAANGVGAMRNSLARWAPLPDDDVLWLAFSSRQEQGAASGAASQIWVTAIDPELMRVGYDPSAAPYWLPGQAVYSDNHLPVWWSQ
ncbi:hypothetical protein LBMAG42_53430 [Deltaproteobacteria bacterium]|nr:hypothetical protein LBMAG42_53430 [Deltaproteobacteria bacterium]